MVKKLWSQNCIMLGRDTCRLRAPSLKLAPEDGCCIFTEGIGLIIKRQRKYKPLLKSLLKASAPGQSAYSQAGKKTLVGVGDNGTTRLLKRLQRWR